MGLRRPGLGVCKKVLRRDLAVGDLVNLLDGDEIRPALFLTKTRNRRAVNANHLGELCGGQFLAGKVFGKLHKHIVPIGHVHCKRKSAYQARVSAVPNWHTASMSTEARKPSHFLREWRTYRDLTQERLGEMSGIGRTAITKIESGRTPLMDYHLKGLSKALQIAIPQIYGKPPERAPLVTGEPEIIPNIVSPHTGNPALPPDVPEELRAHLRPDAPLRAGEKNIPIRGYGKGGHGGFFIDQGALVGMTYRPMMLADVPDAYAIEVWDHSMHPALKHGHVALVHPHKTPLPGDEVVIVLTNGEALIKELVRRTEKTLTLLQHNPPEEIRIDRARIKTIHLIVDSPRVRL